MAQAYIIDLGVALGAVPAPAESPLEEARVLGFSESDAVELTDPDARRAPEVPEHSELVIDLMSAIRASMEKSGPR